MTSIYSNTNFPITFKYFSKQQIGCGLINYRNNCFFNSALQALFNIPKISKKIVNELQGIKSNFCKSEDKCVLCAVLCLFRQTKCSQAPHRPQILYETLQKTSQSFAKILDGKHQDPHEFLMLLMDKIDNKNHGASWIPKTFTANISTEIRCSMCRTVYKTPGTVGDFALNIGKNQSIQMAFNSYFKYDFIMYKCDSCKVRTTATKKLSMVTAPNCLWLHLKRFSKGNKKVNRNIDITTELKLYTYDANDQPREWEYKLVAVVNHLGAGIHCGHYNTIVCTTNNEYIKYDDSKVPEIVSSIGKSNQAYILFYELTEEINDEAEGEMTSEEEMGEEKAGDEKTGKEKTIEEETQDEEQWSEVEIINEDVENSIDIPAQDIYDDTRSPNDKWQEWTEVEIIDDVGETTEVEIIDVGDWNEVEIDDDVATIQELTENTGEVSEPGVNNEEVIRNETENNFKNVDKNIDYLSGRRIVDIDYFCKQMLLMTKNVCTSCNVGQMIFANELKRGLTSIFTFQCTFCNKTHRINSSPLINTATAGVNEASSIGIVSIGLGFYHLQEFLAHLNIPCMSYSTFHKYDKKLQGDWWQVAKKFEEDALNEEIRLAKQNNDVDSEGNALIPVEIDGSWGKRSFGSNYTSLSGCAAIIGRRTNKILYSDVKNKYCHICRIAETNGKPPKIHECKKNYDGPSSGMETQIIIEGFQYCAKKGAIFNKYIGDGDSSTYKALRDLRLYPNKEVEKFECENHIYRNYTKKCDNLPKNTKFKLRGRKLLPPAIGVAISKGVRMAAKHWREADIELAEKYENLEKDVLNAPLHYCGMHDNCAIYFCDKDTDSEALGNISVLKETGIFYEILDLSQHYFANNVKSLIAGYHTNKTEGFNSLICKTLGGKRICNSLDGESYRARTAIADVQYNTKGHSGSQYHELIFGNNMQSCLQLENSRKRKVASNANAKAKKVRMDADVKVPKTKKPIKKGKRRIHYGLGREDVDKPEKAYEIAKNTSLERLRENQVNREIIQSQTCAQRHSFKWIEVRRNMLTTSYFGRILNVKNRNSYTNIVEEIIRANSAFSNTAEINHQRTYELEALSIFSYIYGNESIRLCGIFIDAEFCFLGATPFRLYGEDAIVVPKCPKKAFGMKMADAINKNLLPFWIGPSNDRRVNTKSHWYFEIQGQLRITGKSMAYLVIYLGEHIYEILELERNDAFWKDEMEKELEFFYNEAMLKELVDSRYDRNMDLRKYDIEKRTFV